MSKKPNIVWFLGDQMRADALSHLGNPISKTPNMDALLQEGVSFRNAYCQNPVCVPSRCSFLSGLYPHTLGHRTMHFLQNSDEPNILRIMKEAGYEVIWIGTNDVIPSSISKLSYCDEYYDGIHAENRADYIPDPSALQHHGPMRPKMPFTKDMYSFCIGKLENEIRMGQSDNGCIQAALDYLERRKKEGSEKPFFLYCSLNFPHPPYGCTEPWYSLIERSNKWKRKPYVTGKPSMMTETADNMDLHDYSEEKWNELRAVYLGMVAKVDHQLGEVINKLKETGVYDDTSLFVFADHGDYTGDYDLVEKVQNCFENSLTNIPLIIKPAKQFEVKPRITEALAELTDLSATVSEMTETPLNYVSYGKSLLPVIAGSEEGKDAVFAEGGRIHGETQAMEQGHNDPEDPYWPRLSVQQKEGAQHTKAAMIRMGNLKYVMRLYEEDEFYDLKKDPQELINEINNPLYAAQLNELKERMLEWYMESADYVPKRKDR